MRPLIGLSCSADDDGTPVVRPPYVKAIHRAGGLPVPLPFVDDVEQAHALLERLAGVVLSGSEDLDPSLWGEPRHPLAQPMHPARQTTELALCRALLEREHPLLAICGGMQSLTLAAGGTLHQHLPDLDRVLLDHAVGFDGAPHEIVTRPGSLLARLLGDRLQVNSAHHQAVARPGAGWRACAHAPDQVLEACELPGRRFAVGVQWHPERMPHDARQQGLFNALVNAARD